MLTRTLALCLGLFGAVITSQLPEFAQQYTQRLGGAVDELADYVRAFDRNARAVGLSLAEAIERLQRDTSDLVQRQAADAQTRVRRYERLAPHYEAMARGSGADRVWTFVTGMDATVARRTFQDFQPALPLTAFAAVMALAGFLLGLGATYGVRSGTKRILRSGGTKAWFRRPPARGPGAAPPPAAP